MGHPIFARIYARRSAREAKLQEGHRRSLVDGLHGRVLEVGCGNGLNFLHYPNTVREVVGVEPEPYLRRQARRAAHNVPVTVVAGRAESLAEVVSGHFDAVVFSLVLCSVADPRTVLREAKKVLRPGAAVRVYEHVLADDVHLARWQHLGAPLWARTAGGCRPDRDTLALLRQEFDIAGADCFEFCPGPRLPLAIVAPHILVAGTRRASDVAEPA
jgi:SAM-dependent methyltransferase